MVIMVIVPGNMSSQPRPTCETSFPSVPGGKTLLVHGPALPEESVPVPEGAVDPLGLLVHLPGGLHESEEEALPQLQLLLRVDDGHVALLGRIVPQVRVGRACFLLGALVQ